MGRAAQACLPERGARPGRGRGGGGDRGGREDRGDGGPGLAGVDTLAPGGDVHHIRRGRAGPHRGHGGRGRPGAAGGGDQAPGRGVKGSADSAGRVGVRAGPVRRGGQAVNLLVSLPLSPTTPVGADCALPHIRSCRSGSLLHSQGISNFPFEGDISKT